MLKHDGDITVAAVCATAEEAIAALPRVRPDVVTIDVELPGMDGLAAIEEIIARRPLPILVISVNAGNTSRKAAAALAAGALDAISKDDLDLDDPGGSAAAAFRSRARLLSHAQVIRHPRARLRKTPVPQRPGRRASVIGMCGSTGGPYVLARLLGDLPAEYPIPILVVQHISDGFTEGLVHWLDHPAGRDLRQGHIDVQGRKRDMMDPSAPRGEELRDRRLETGGSTSSTCVFPAERNATVTWLPGTGSGTDSGSPSSGRQRSSVSEMFDNDDPHMVELHGPS